MPRSEESRLESMADPTSWGDFDENDPKSMARVIETIEKAGREGRAIYFVANGGSEPGRVERDDISRERFIRPTPAA